jgi:uncharacterized protein YjbI with pentapeptide repeats
MENNELSMEWKRIYFFGSILFIVGVVQFTFVRDYLTYSDVPQGIMIEAFGFTADIILFGIAITIYESFWKNKELLIRYLEELEDYRGWDEKEASYRIFGLIKRLHKLKKFTIDLSGCYFENIQFSKNSFNGFDFKQTLLYGTKFINCNLQLSTFNNIEQKHIEDIYDYMTVIEKSTFDNCNLRDSKFMNNKNYVDLQFLVCDMKNADLSNSVFLWCRFDDIDFSTINTDNTLFKQCSFNEKCKNIENIQRIDKEKK